MVEAAQTKNTSPLLIGAIALTPATSLVTY